MYNSFYSSGLIFSSGLSESIPSTSSEEPSYRSEINQSPIRRRAINQSQRRTNEGIQSARSFPSLQITTASDDSLVSNDGVLVDGGSTDVIATVTSSRNTTTPRNSRSKDQETVILRRGFLTLANRQATGQFFIIYISLYKVYN